jgi:hypothetical protein
LNSLFDSKATLEEFKETKISKSSIEKYFK